VAQRPQFQDLYVARRSAVRATAYLLCGDWHLAEDLAQAAFVRMYQRWGRIQHRDGLEAYLHRTVVRLWIDETRRRRHRDTLVAEPPETQEHANPAQPDPACSGPCAGCRRGSGPVSCCGTSTTSAWRRRPSSSAARPGP
jgi:RNA polymerase sigma factor (sigma-70 family)